MYVRPNSSKLIFSGTQATTGFASTSNKLYHIDSCLGKLTEFQKDCNGNICNLTYSYKYKTCFDNDKLYEFLNVGNGRVVFDFRSPIIPQAGYMIRNLINSNQILNNCNPSDKKYDNYLQKNSQSV